MVKRVVWCSVLVIVLLTVSAGTVMAGQRRGGGGGGAAAPIGACVFAVVGEVVAVDVETQSISVQVLTVNHLVKDCFDEELMISTTVDTLFRRFGDPDCVLVAFEDVEVGAYVSVGGCVVADAAGIECLVAERVTVNVPVVCLP